MTTRLGLRVLVLAALAPLAASQKVLYQTSFDDVGSWTGAIGTQPCGFDVDAVPALFGGYRSAPASLNCNTDGVNGYAGCQFGWAQSPDIDVSTSTFGATLTFWCAYELEENKCNWDTRHLYVSNDDFATTLLDICYLWQDCGGSGLEPWHVHDVPLDPAWGTVKIRFAFWIGDNQVNNNLYDGWFLDDLTVTSDCPTSVLYCTAKTNSAGCTPAISTTGVASYSGSGPAFRLHAGNVLNQHPGILIWSLGQAAIPFGGGTLCLSSPVHRTPGQLSGGTVGPPDCTGSYSYNFTPGKMQAEGLVPGTSVYSQYWSRDTGFTAPDNIGLTAGVGWTVCN